jgi:hypothetical protein
MGLRCGWLAYWPVFRTRRALVLSTVSCQVPAFFCGSGL